MKWRSVGISLCVGVLLVVAMVYAQQEKKAAGVAPVAEPLLPVTGLPVRVESAQEVIKAAAAAKAAQEARLRPVKVATKAVKPTPPPRKTVKVSTDPLGRTVKLTFAADGLNIFPAISVFCSTKGFSFFFEFDDEGKASQFEITGELLEVKGYSERYLMTYTTSFGKDQEGGGGSIHISGGLLLSLGSESKMLSVDTGAVTVQAEVVD